MHKLLTEIRSEIKNLHKIRTFTLLGLLVLFITVSLALSQGQTEQFQTKTYAQAGQGTVAYMVYGTGHVNDTIAPGWTAKSWYGGGNTVNLTVTDPTYDGVHSISFQSTAPSDVMELYTDTPITISPYTYVTFYGRGGMEGLRYQVYLLGPPNAEGNHTLLGNGLTLEQYGGVPPTNQWFTYNFPISAFNAGTSQVYGIGLMDLNGGGAQAPMYLDEIAFSAARGPDTTPTPQIGPPATQGPSPTRVPDYYPNISPWVFIIPAIIIFLAIFFE